MAMTKTIQATVKNRTDTAANWTQKNPVLAEGEIIVVQTSAGETRLKIGDGVKTFTQLPYTDEQIYNNVVTSVNGQTGDVTLDVSGGSAGTLVQSDWNQNDETASDYIKNRPGGYSKQVSINIDTDITAGMEKLVVIGENYLYKLPIDNINDLLGAKLGNTQNAAVTLDSIILYQGDDKVKMFMGVSDSELVAIFYMIKEDNTALDDNNTVIVDKGIYVWISDVGNHIYINNNGTVRYPIDASLLPINSASDYIRFSRSEAGVHLFWNLKFDQRQFQVNKDIDGNPELYIRPLYKAGTGIAISENRVISGAYKAGNGISISNDGTISVTTATYYTGTADPVNTLGADGDLYLKTEG